MVNTLITRLATLAESCQKTGWVVHAYCLMGNHFHLVVETPQPNLVAGMKWLLGTYTVRFNRRHGLTGHLAQAREKLGANHYGRERAEAAEEKAGRIVKEEWKRLGWAKEELGRRLKDDPEKVRIARRLRGETTVTLKWIAACLVMGTWTYVANRFYHA